MHIGSVAEGRSVESGDRGYSAKDKGEIGEIYGIEDTPRVRTTH